MSLRISSPSKTGGGRRGGAGEELEPDFYMSRLIKLLPAEAVAVYPMLHNRALDVVKDVKDANQIEAGKRSMEVAPASGQAASAATDGASSVAAPITDAVSSVATGSAPIVETAAWLPPAMAWFVLLLVILLRWQATRDAAGNPQWGAVAIAAVSFFLWVPTMNGSFGVMEFAETAQLISWPEPVQKFVPEFLLIFWTIFVPAFYKPQN